MLPHVTDILKGGGLVDDTWYTEEGKDLGKALHTATEILDRGLGLDWDSIDPRIRGHVQSYLRFLKENKPRIIEIELDVVNARYSYVGRLDRIVIMFARQGVMDIKKGGASDWHGVQLAAYAKCFPGVKLARWNLYLGDKTYKLVDRTRDALCDWQTFLEAKRQHERNRTNDA